MEKFIFYASMRSNSLSKIKIFYVLVFSRDKHLCLDNINIFLKIQKIHCAFNIQEINLSLLSLHNHGFFTREH